MKNSFSAFVVTFALGLCYAVVALWVAFAATAIVGGWMPNLMFAIFFAGGNCALALLLGVFVGVSPIRRCWAIFPAPVVLIVTYRAVAGAVTFTVFFIALVMLSLSLLGMQVAVLIRIIKNR